VKDVSCALTGAMQKMNGRPLQSVAVGVSFHRTF
jgi:hypothetical protein